MWPMTQARLCCSGSEGIDGEKYQAGPGSPRQGWKKEQTPQLRLEDVMFCGWYRPPPHRHALLEPKLGWQQIV